MRKLTQNEVVALCAVVGAISLGNARQGKCDEMMLPQVTATACGVCDKVAPNLYFIPITVSGDAGFTPGTVGPYSGTTTPFNPNPNCSTPNLDVTDIKNFILQNEGSDANVQTMTWNYYGAMLDNETGFVPPASFGTPYSGSGLTVDGVDFAQWKLSQFTYYGVPESILANVTQFMIHCGGSPCFQNQVPGLKGQDALSAIYSATNYGATDLFDTTGVQEIFSAGYQYTLGNLQRNIGSVNFGTLPNLTQTALADFAFKVDAGFLYTTPGGQQVQTYVENGEWQLLADYLSTNFGTRGALDAVQIYEDIVSGKLPEYGSAC
jgi:hypothetical protein